MTRKRMFTALALTLLVGAACQHATAASRSTGPPSETSTGSSSLDTDDAVSGAVQSGVGSVATGAGSTGTSSGTGAAGGR